MGSPTLRDRQFYTTALARTDLSRIDRAMLEDELARLPEVEAEHQRVAEQVWRKDIASVRQARPRGGHTPPLSSGGQSSLKSFARSIGPVLHEHVERIVKEAAQPVITQLATRIAKLEAEVLELRAERGRAKAKAVQRADNMKRAYVERSNGVARH